MKRILYLIIFIFLPYLSFTQITGKNICETKKVKFNKIEGVIIGDSCDVPLAGTDKRALITHSEIEDAERALLIQINKVLAQDSRVHGDYQISKPERHFKKYKRQYFGYLESGSEDKIIYINLLDFSGIGKRKKFEGWEHNFILGFGDFYERNLISYEYNLTTNKIRIP